MENLVTAETIETYLATVRQWLFENVFVLSNLSQAIVIAAAFVFARYLAPRLADRITKLSRWRGADYWIAKVGDAFAPLSLPLVWLFLQWISGLVAAQAAWPHRLLTITVSLLTAWIIIHLTSTLVRDKTWSKFIAVTAWSIAALNIVGLLDPTIKLLDDIAVDFGDVHISVLTVIKGVLLLAFLLWLASAASQLLEQRIRRLPNITPSVQVLFSKLLKIVLVTFAIVAALGGVGIDLTAFAVFSGAVGVGVGFGLQKIVSNLISGVIILMDKSIKPGDVIEVGGTYGWINSLGGRYASVVTRDGIEHLIPNEELITQRVANWSHSDNQVRLRIPVGISYGSDVLKAMALCLEAAAETPRVIASPKSVCLVTGFGDSSVDLELRIWIDDPKNGISNIKSEVMLGIWNKFHEHGIEIPFPQRDLHIKSSALPAAPPLAGDGK